MTKLELTRLDNLTPHQIKLLGSLILHFDAQHMRAVRRCGAYSSGIPKDYTHPIALTNIYHTFKLNSKTKPMVKAVANMFFEQVTRGNNKTKKCSSWRIREEIRLNTPLATIISELQVLNTAHAQQVNDSVMETDAEKRAKNIVTLGFEFKSDQQREYFKSVVAEYLAEMEQLFDATITIQEQ